MVAIPAPETFTPMPWKEGETRVARMICDVVTPDGKPFYGGTYFPPVDRYGRTGFPTLLNAIAQAWKSRRSELEQSANELLSHVRANAEGLAVGGATTTSSRSSWNSTRLVARLANTRPSPSSTLPDSTTMRSRDRYSLALEMAATARMSAPRSIWPRFRARALGG